MLPRSPVAVLSMVGLSILAGCRDSATVGPPSFVFILADDLNVPDLTGMEQTRREVVDRGMTLRQTFVTTSLCCPSRASILTGAYSHNHGVWALGPPDGGFPGFLASGREGSTIATWLNAAGYHTGLFGKYFDHYPRGGHRNIPAGWDEWSALFTAGRRTESGRSSLYEGFSTMEDGKRVRQTAYQTDFLTQRAVDFILRAGATSAPFFLYLAPSAPHQPATPAPRHRGLFRDATAPRGPAFDEEDVSDKPAWIRDRPRLSDAELLKIDAMYRGRLATTLGLDDLVGAVARALRRSGRERTTYLVLTSDNGLLLGQHRLIGKQVAYTESIQVPLVIRGPGVAAASSSDALVLNIDFAPTFAELAGVAPGNEVDGRSFAPILAGGTPADWRRDFLVEHKGVPGRGMPSQRAVRSHDTLYVSYGSGERELYDLSRDPWELENLAPSADATRLAQLQARLEALASCRGSACR